MSKGNPVKSGSNINIAEHQAKPVVATVPNSIDIFAPPNEPLTYEEISSSWGKPIRSSIEKTITAPEQTQVSEPSPPIVHRKKIPTW